MSVTPPRPPTPRVLHLRPVPCARKVTSTPVLKYSGGLAVLGLAGSGVWWLKEPQPPPTGPAAQITVSVDPADPNILSALPAPASTSPVVAAAASATVADFTSHHAAAPAFLKWIFATPGAMESFTLRSLRPIPLRRKSQKRRHLWGPGLLLGQHSPRPRYPGQYPLGRWSPRPPRLDGLAKAPPRRSGRSLG